MTTSGPSVDCIIEAKDRSGKRIGFGFYSEMTPGVHHGHIQVDELVFKMSSDCTPS